MKRITKLFILLLALCMIVPCIAACNKDKGGQHKTPPPEENTTASNGGDTNDWEDDDDDTGDGGDEEVVEIEMPDKINMGGYTYKAYVRDYAGESPDAHKAQVNNGNNDYRCIDFWVDANNSEEDVIPYAVYSRNQQIENDYNCKIRQISSNGSQLEYLVGAIQNQDKLDLTIITAKPAAQAATQGLLRNLTGSQYIDLTRDSFDQNAINELSVKDKLYFISGDMNISTMDVAGLSIVNMDFYEDLADSIVEAFYNNVAYSNIYNLVNAGEWTMANMLKIAELANIDAGNDGGELHVLPNGITGGAEDASKYQGGDVVGYHQYLYSAVWYFYGSGGRITTKGDDGLPELVIQETTAQTLYDYIFDKFNRKINAPWIPHESSNILNMNFLTGDVLFADCSLFNVRTEIYPKAQFEYGILPIPVYEKGMQYKSLVYFYNWAHLWAIPTNVQNAEYAERMLEIMAVYSSLPGSTMEAYYMRTIYMMAAKDNGSRPVMNIIRASRVYDLALLYPSWGGIEEKLYQIPNREESEYANIVASQFDIQDSMDATIEILLNPYGN